MISCAGCGTKPTIDTSSAVNVFGITFKQRTPHFGMLCYIALRHG